MRALALWASELATPGEVVRHLVAVQSQDHVLARWSVAQRLDHPVRASVVDDAFDRGELIRTHVLRPTWHYVSPHDLRWLVRFSGPRVAARTARYWAQFGLDARKLSASTEAIARAVEEGPATRPELAARLGRRGAPVGPAELAARVMHAELHSAVCSGPLRGRQHTYVPFDQRARGEGPVGEDALGLLARRYFSTRGPATVQDFSWWAGLTMADARRGMNLAAVDLEFHEEGGRRYAFVPQDERCAPSVDFVQCYDEVVVSYRESRDVLKTPQVSFEPLQRDDGFVHVILRAGQLLGRWRVAEDRSIEVRLAASPSTAEREVLADRMAALGSFLSAATCAPDREPGYVPSHPGRRRSARDGLRGHVGD
jgi:hypothetical protein